MEHNRHFHVAKYLKGKKILKKNPAQFANHQISTRL